MPPPTSPQPPDPAPQRQSTGDLPVDVLSILVEAGEALAAPIDVAEVAEAAVQFASRVVPRADAALVLTPPGRSEVLRCIAGTGHLSLLVGWEQTVEGTLSGRALRTGRPVETEDAPRESAIAAAIGIHASRCARLVPLLAGRIEGGETVLGVLGVYRDAPLDDSERSLLDSVARRASLAVHRARLLEDTRRTAAHLKTTLDTALDVVGQMSPDTVLARLVRRAAQALQADRATASRIEGDDAVVEASWAAHGEPIARGTRWRIADHPLLVSPVLEGRPMTASVDEIAPTTYMEGMDHVLTVPMSVAGETLAIIGVSRAGGRTFDEGEVSLLRQLGAVTALMLHSTELLAIRSQFMNMAAHELRTPVSVINGYLSMLLDGSFGPVPDQWRAPLHVLEERNRELGRLVDDLLLAARLEAGRVLPSRDPVDLGGLAEAAVARSRSRVDLLGGTIEYQPPAGPVRGLADPAHVGRILDNLVSNACAFVCDGRPPAVRVAVGVEDHLGVVTVEDDGTGIPEGVRERIFEPFYRHESGAARFVPGTGLGLAMSRQLAVQNGGSLTLDWSEPGTGSRFALRLALLSPPGS